MKRIQLMAAALCAAACVTTTAFAEDQNGLESATPVEIADPINPKPGMVFNAYGYDDHFYFNYWKENVSKLPKWPALSTGVDVSESFSIECATGVKPKAVRWEGFLKSKYAKTYTFLVQTGNKYERDCYSVSINGQPVYTAYGEGSFDVDLKVGWNKVEISRQFYDSKAMNISAKIKGGLSEPTKLTPAKFFYDDRPELQDNGL